MWFNDQSQVLVPDDLPDAHTHFPRSSSPDERDFLFSKRRCIVNSTGPDEWADIAQLSQQYPNIIPAFGIHPWRLNEDISEDTLLQLDRILEGNPRATIGEVGLDKVRRPHVDMVYQRKIFDGHLSLAREHQRLISVHCVRAVGALLEALQHHHANKVLVHGWQGPPEIVPTLVRLGCYFSLGIRQLQRPNILQQLAVIPPHRFLIESDGEPNALSQAWLVWSDLLDQNSSLPYPSSPETRLDLLHKNFDDLLGAMK